MLNQEINTVPSLEETEETTPNEVENSWRSCCFSVDKNATVFISQLSVCILVISFCMYQLLHSKSCEKDSLYSGLLTLILGIIIPNPRR